MKKEMITPTNSSTATSTSSSTDTSATLTIDRKALTYLVTAYDAAMRLFTMTCELSGDTLSARSVVSEVLKVTDALRRICGDDLAVDWEDSVVRMVLDGDGSVEERAKRLMGV